MNQWQIGAVIDNFCCTVRLFSITAIESGLSKISPRLTIVVTKTLCPESSRAVKGVDTQ